MSDFERYRKAIQSIESSGGNYGLLGPVTKSGDRAYGAYQVMGNNIPEWTTKHLGRAYSPQEFLADKEAQDKVFDAQFGGYVKKYGNPQDAASAWFTGGPMSTGANKRDILGTSGSGYVDKFNKYLGSGGDGVSAINAAAGIGAPASGGALASAFAPEGPTDVSARSRGGALTTDEVMGSGALNGGGTDKMGVIARMLMGVGASLSGISNPDQAKSMNQQLAMMQKGEVDPGTWVSTQLKNGQIMQTHSKTGQMRFSTGNYGKEDDAGAIEQKKLEAKSAHEKYTASQEAVGNADEGLRQSNMLRKALSDPNVTLGGLGEPAVMAKNIAYSMGINVKGLDNSQLIQRVATEMQLARGKMLPGAISNYEDKLMGLANGVGLDKSLEANLAALDARDALYKHQKMLAQEARKYKEKHGKLDEGWDAYRSSFEPPAAPAPAAPAAPPASAPPSLKSGTTFKTKNGVSYSY